MDFVATVDSIAICRLSGCSDVIHIEGIGALGRNYSLSELMTEHHPLPRAKAWSIDCLPTSGLFRLFCMGYRLTCGEAVSSFEIYSTERRKNEETENR